MPERSFRGKARTRWQTHRRNPINRPTTNAQHTADLPTPTGAPFTHTTCTRYQGITTMSVHASPLFKLHQAYGIYHAGMSNGGGGGCSAYCNVACARVALGRGSSRRPNPGLAAVLVLPHPRQGRMSGRWLVLGLRCCARSRSQTRVFKREGEGERWSS